MQQMLHYTPLDVGWLLLTGNIAYGIAVVAAGRLADAMNPNILVVVGLAIFAAAFFWFAAVNETVMAGTLIFLLTLRLTSFGIMGSPNNLAAMQALPEEQVVMASGIFALARSISGTMGTVVSATFYEERYAYHLQRYAESHDWTAPGIQDALLAIRQVLERAGEIPALLAVQTEALLQVRLQVEAGMIAYQDYFFLAAVIVVVAMLPALPWGDFYQSLRQSLASRSLPALPFPQEADLVAGPRETGRVGATTIPHAEGTGKRRT
jgi:DHA2 family multidrug resistance protein